jgi:hypothetical protein
VIEMIVHGGYRQVMMVMLQAGQALSQFAFVMIEDIRKIGHAVASRRLTLAVALNGTTNQIAHRL